MPARADQINRDAEALVPLAAVIAAAPFDISTKTAHRWITEGCRGKRLAAHRIGGRWYTTHAAFARFVGLPIA